MPMTRIKGAICFSTVMHISDKMYTHDICHYFHFPNRKYLSWFPPTGAQAAPPPACNARGTPPTTALQAAAHSAFFPLSPPSPNPAQLFMPPWTLCKCIFRKIYSRGLACWILSSTGTALLSSIHTALSCHLKVIVGNEAVHRMICFYVSVL